MFSLITSLLLSFVSFGSATPFTQLSSDTDATAVRFLDDSRVFVQTEQHSGVWNTSAQSAAAFDSNDTNTPGRVACGLIAVAASNKKAAVYLYDSKTYQLVKTLQPTTDPNDVLTGLSFNGDCSRAIVTLLGKSDPFHSRTFYFMDVLTGQVIQSFDLTMGGGYIEPGELNRSGSLVLIHHDNGASLYDLSNHKFISIYSTNSLADPSTYIPRFSSDDRYVIVVGVAGTVDRYNIATGKWKSLARVFSYLNPYVAVAHPRDPTKFFVIGEELLEVDVEQGIVRQFASTIEFGGSTEICANDDLLMVSQPFYSQLFDLKTGAAVKALTHDGSWSDMINSCDLSSDGKYAVIGSNYGARLYSLEQNNRNRIKH